MPEFQLKKPLYQWAAPGDMSPVRTYDLSDELIEWLEMLNIAYTTRTSRVTRYKGTYLYHYIDIPDKKQAMLFKLTWL